MESILAAIRDATKNPLTAFIVLVVTGGMIFLPEDRKIALGLTTFMAKNGVWVLAAFCGSVAILLYHLAASGIQVYKKSAQERENSLKMQRTLKTLTENEKWVLRQFTTKKTRSQTLDRNSGTVARLMRLGILRDGGLQGFTGEESMFTKVPIIYFSMNISDAAYDYLLEHPELLEITKAATDETPAEG